MHPSEVSAWWWSPRRWWSRLIRVEAAPARVAFGAAVGVFIAFTPTMGFQILLAALAATLLRTSRAAAMLAVWITNPLTMVPIYAVTFAVGAALIPGSVVEELASPQIAEGDVLDEPTVAYAITGARVAAALLLGGAVVGLLAAVLTYSLVRRAVEAVQADSGSATTRRAR